MVGCLGDFTRRRSWRRLEATGAAAAVCVVGCLHLDISSSALVVVHGFSAASVVVARIGPGTIITTGALGLVVGGRILVALLRLLGLLVVWIILGLAVTPWRSTCPARTVVWLATVLASATRAEASVGDETLENANKLYNCRLGGDFVCNHNQNSSGKSQGRKG